MFFLFPYRVDVSTESQPVANWVLLFTTAVCFLAIDPVIEVPRSGVLGEYGLTEEGLHLLVAQGWGWGLAGHVLLHAGWLHLLGNAIFLWVFGNAVCSPMGPGKFLGTYIALGIFAVVIHLTFVGTPAVGASAAINGLVGMCLVWYPREYLSCLMVLGASVRTFEVPAYTMIVLWFLFDITGVVLGTGGVGYVAHIAGFLAGCVWAVVLLKMGWVSMPSYQATLLDQRWRS